MDIGFKKLSKDQTINHIVNIWPVEVIFYFLEFICSFTEFHVDIKNIWGRTALELLSNKSEHGVCSPRDKLVMKLLLKYGADPLQLCQSGTTIIQKVAKSEDSSLFKTFLHYVNINFPLDVLFQSTALHLAVQKGCKDVLNYVLGRKPDVNSKTLPMLTPLHLASLRDDVEVTRILIEHGANLEARDVGGETALFHAVRFGKIQQMRKLIQYGANVNSRNYSSETLLHVVCASCSDHNHLEVCGLLLSAGSDPNAVDERGRTPLHYLATGYDAFNTVKLVELLLKYGACLNVQDNDGDTKLHHIAYYLIHPPAFIIFLMKRGADPNVRNKSGQTFMGILQNHEGVEAFTMLQHILMNYIGGKLQLKEQQLTSILSNRQFVLFKESCMKELLALIGTKVAPHLSCSLLSVLIGSERQIAKFCRNSVSYLWPDVELYVQTGFEKVSSRSCSY
ncbi:poly [ADP-ribose] polymerase tankyrase-2-like [Harmonia axyridis]|uniref:poly [ADP-ribose] polymerase tankyrase-2-like n=1 Tax=Harmonia axyridis TaxID=115357 RepID=UPI001E278926|nr:poly [ADP-ribose] polymerase tankyrase-2-like [Harmonia axyridis]